MKGELRYAHSKVFSRIIWLLVYIILFIALLVGLYRATANIQTRSLPVGQIQLTVPYSKYLVGEAVTFKIKNNYNSPVYIVNDCPAAPLNVYRLENTIWVRIHDTASLSDCPTENRQITVAANGSVDGSFAAWHHLFDVPGKYRVVAYVEYYDALPYQEFEVVAPAPIPKPAAIVAPVVAPIIYRQPVQQAAPQQTTTTTFTNTESTDD